MSQAPRDAQPPFSGAPHPLGNTPPSDVIIRSSDGVDLHVHRAVVGYASVFFNDMFAIVGTGTNTGDIFRDGKPVVVCDEPLAVLYQLLCMAYPGGAPVGTQGLDGIAEVHRVANKYIFATLQEQLEAMLATPALLALHPHRIFAIAHLRDLPDIARAAALRTLNAPVCPADLAFPELDLLSARTLQNLYNFHHTCGKAAERIATSDSDAIDYTDPSDPVMQSPHGFKYVWWEGAQRDYHTAPCGPVVSVVETPDVDWLDLAPTPWFKNHTAAVGAKLRAVPSRAIAETEGCILSAGDHEVIDGCHACTGDARFHLQSWSEQLAARIEASNTELATRFL
ncbi:hypothetical protein C8R46DRAFT_950432 [Mycena filopes]|nr:hypothetical protein C8R46DRAFT_950432 [Mycena filopes]